jgi:hypothetical protein
MAEAFCENIHGDQLPFGDYQHDTEIRLPNGQKSMVYDMYRDDMMKDPTQSRILLKKKN